jgi:hypothetical protein
MHRHRRGQAGAKAQAVLGVGRQRSFVKNLDADDFHAWASAAYATHPPPCPVDPGRATVA